MVSIAQMTKADILAVATGTAVFMKWLKFILDWECTIDKTTGFILSEDDGDGAGITVAGLTARDDEFPAEGITPIWVATKYKIDYWNKCSGDDLNYPLGPVLANFGVNCGIETAIVMLQLCLCDYGQKVTCDGIIGSQTMSAVLKISDKNELSLALISKANSRYKRLASFHPDTFGRDLAGWLNRDNALKETFCS